jgi:BioD-like phosphotransacetylase family protein
LGVLYIVAAEKGAGKTAVCAGIAANLMSRGKNVGYLKPPADSPDSDSAFMRQVLGTADTARPDTSEGRDIVLVEASLGAAPTDKLSQNTYGAAREMKARAIAVKAYSDWDSCGPAPYADVYKGFGADLLGVILNKVPVSRLARAKEEAEKRFAAAEIRLLGVIPEERALLAVTIGELAAAIQGTFLNGEEKSGELVERFMLGAMTVGSGLDYFGRLSNKAAIVHQDRLDMQLAALETPTRCLVLSGGQEPPPYNVRRSAELKGIPVIATVAGTADIVNSIEVSLLNTRLNQVRKVDRLAALVRQNLDLAAIA